MTTSLRERGPMVGMMLEADFTKDTITFHMPATYYAEVGRYIIEPEGEWLRRKDELAAAIAALTAPASPPALEGMDLLRPTPMRATSYGTQEPEYRMDAYWYGFSPTGLDIIDTILSAVACAGKGYHSTEQWNEDSDPRHDRLRGTTPVAHIQNAANDAAAAIRAASPAAPAQPEGGDAVESCPRCGGDCGSANPPVAFCPMREAACIGVPKVEGLHPDTEHLVAGFAHALAAKLKAAQDKYGYDNGWLRTDWMDECRAHLLEHVAKGDPRDVAAYCAFLWHHGESTSPGEE